MAESKREKLLESIVEFLKSNLDEVEIIKRDFSYNVDSPEDLIDLLSRQMATLHGGYMDKLFDLEDSKDYIRDYRNSAYLECAKKLLYAYKYAFIPIKASWEYASDRLYRELLIPARATVLEVMYSVVSSFRALSGHLMMLDYSDMKFYTRLDDVSNYNNSGAESVYGDDYLALLLYARKEAELIYDYGEEYRFNLEIGKMRYLDDNLYFKPVIVENGSGYGILEDMKSVLEGYIDDPDGVFELYDTKYKALIPFDFEEFNLEEMNENIFDYFIMATDLYDPEFRESLYEDDDMEDFVS